MALLGRVKVGEALEAGGICEVTGADEGIVGVEDLGVGHEKGLARLEGSDDFKGSRLRHVCSLSPKRRGVKEHYRGRNPPNRLQSRFRPPIMLGGQNPKVKSLLGKKQGPEGP